MTMLVATASRGEASTVAPVRQLDIPSRTWIARPYNTPNAPAAGYTGKGGGSKHLRAAQNLLNGKVYFAGGDYQSNVHSWLGVWSYDPITNKWELEYPHCGFAGEIMPAGMDEVGWVWDSKRSVFWMLPGYTVVGGPGNNVPRCPGGATQTQAILTFDPVAKKWSNPGVAPEPIAGQKPKNAIYDPRTDSIYRAGTDPRGNIWTVYHIAENRWEVYQTVAAGNTYVNDIDLGFEYLAADTIGRKIYAIDPIMYRLFAFDMDKHTVSIKAPIPELNPERVRLARQTRQRPYIWQDFTMPVFDSFNRVLLFPYIDETSRPKLLIYTPTTDTWEIDKMYQPERREVRGNTAVFLPSHNAMMVLGGLQIEGDIDPSVTHFFLYRYSNDKEAPAPRAPPSSERKPAPEQ